MWLGLRISPEERELLLDILTTDLGILRTEICQTVHNEWVKEQKRRRHIAGGSSEDD
jgi:hypothetical protein